MQKTKLIAATVIAILMLIIVLQNTDSVETKVLFTTVTMPRAAMLFGTLFVGIGLGVLAAGRPLFVGPAKDDKQD